MPYRRGHAPYLAVLSFNQLQLQPRGWHRFTEANWWIARCKAGMGLHQSRLARKCFAPLNQHSQFELRYACGVRHTFDLRPINSGMSMFGMQKPLIETALIR